MDNLKIVVIGLAILLLALTGSAVDLTGSAGKAALTSITGIAPKSFNETLNNSTNGTLNSTNTTGNLSELWRWGGIPAGYSRIGNKIVPGTVAEPNESVMQTPSQLVPGNSRASESSGMLVTPK